MSDGDLDTYPRQTNERSDGEAKEAPEIAQPPKQVRHSKACLAHNMELMAAQMLEMQRQQAAQTVVLNAYISQGFVPHASPVYPPYQPEVYEKYYVNEEERDHHPYTSLTYPEIPLWRNEEVDLLQYQNQRYNMEENYMIPNLPPR
ncbi:hypothetical protein Fot_14213 [Forsythia ovata]|uniref:Uncharacterized protein n=1 Tax=Forsythia ovata TaxID=205694 RepID=A0ABD1W5P1_9LAMI